MGGHAFWAVVKMCVTQIRLTGLGSLVGLDFAAVTMMAEASGIHGQVTARLLPFAEAGVLAGIRVNRPDED